MSRTPGIWYAEGHGNRMADGDQLWAVFAPDDPNDSTGTVLAENLSRADAKLFAAAPDLLAAAVELISIIDRVGNGESENYEFTPEDFDRLRAAVAKAEVSGP